jgi:hypothetical protein
MVQCRSKDRTTEFKSWNEHCLKHTPARSAITLRINTSRTWSVWRQDRGATQLISLLPEGKAVPQHTMEAKGERSYSSYSFSTSALGGVSGQRHAPAALYPPGERTPGTHCTGGWVGLWSGQEARGKILCRGSNFDRPVVQPWSDTTLTDWATPAPKYALVPIPWSDDEMCESEPRSESPQECWKGWKRSVEEEKENKPKYLLPSSFLHSVVRMLGSPNKISGQKRWRLLYVILIGRPHEETTGGLGHMGEWQWNGF